MGEIFGMFSPVNDNVCPITIEVSSQTAVVYKIHRTFFVKHFGGYDGAPFAVLISLILMFNNWMKIRI